MIAPSKLPGKLIQGTFRPLICDTCGKEMEYEKYYYFDEKTYETFLFCSKKCCEEYTDKILLEAL